METAEMKRRILSEIASMVRTKGYLVAGKTPAEVYSLYTEKFEAVVGMTPELLVELQAEAKAMIGFAWPEVRAQALTSWATERQEMKRAQAVTPAMVSELGKVAKALAQLWPAEEK